LFDDRVGYDASAHELAAGAINPANHQDVTSPQLVKEPPALKYRLERGDATSYREK
jgi:hypothetical protein